jgi:small subunit ribosomal protein S35
MGDNHPAEKKVVVQFAPDDLGLTKVQTDKVKKLCGVRYNPETQIVRMSCESYQNQAQNKRFLAEQIDRIVAEAKDGKDTFEDIPLDTRHHKSTKAKARFPKEWLMTEQRQKALEQDRKKFFQIEAQREETHQIVDGKIAIENHLMGKLRQDQEREQSFAPVRAHAAPLRRSLGPKDRANRT